VSWPSFLATVQYGKSHAYKAFFLPHHTPYPGISVHLYLSLTSLLLPVSFLLSALSSPVSLTLSLPHPPFHSFLSPPPPPLVLFPPSLSVHVVRHMPAFVCTCSVYVKVPRTKIT
jgi:hypothetical protein